MTACLYSPEVRGASLALGFRCPELSRRHPLADAYGPALQKPDHELPSLRGARHSSSGPWAVSLTAVVSSCPDSAWHLPQSWATAKGYLVRWQGVDWEPEGPVARVTGDRREREMTTRLPGWGLQRWYVPFHGLAWHKSSLLWVPASPLSSFSDITGTKTKLRSAQSLLQSQLSLSRPQTRPGLPNLLLLGLP